jgi:hypothetical protein
VHRLSFGLIRELCGEFSPLFYALKRRLEEAKAADVLTVFEAEFKAARPSLDEREQRKLQIMLRRRWKTI